MGPVRNQGPIRGTCLAFAVSAAHERALHGPPDPLSVETLYWGAKQHDGDPRPGTTFPAADRALRRWGQPDEVLWPYDPLRTDTDPSYQPPADALEPGNCNFAGLAPIGVSVKEIRDALDAGTAVAIGAPTWPGLRRPTHGHVANPSPGELDGDYHAMVVTGYRLDTNEILLMNSWGASWGDQGHAWISFPFVDDHVIAAWRIEPQPTTQATPQVRSAASRFGTPD